MSSGDFFGSGPAGAGRRLAGSSGFIRPSLRLAILVICAVFALGQLPKGDPILSRLGINLPWSRAASSATAGSGTIHVPSSVSVGSSLSLHGTAPAGNGPVVIQGSYDGGQTWETLANVGSADGTYVADLAPTQRGTLQIRAVFADGSQAFGSTTVG